MRAVVFMTVLLLCCARPALAADLSEMYTRDTLQKDAMRLRTAVGKIYNLGIKPNLTATERDELGEIEFRFPMAKTGDNPLNFYAYRDGRKAIVVMPVLSLKLLKDLTTAYAWVQINDLLHSPIDLYYSALRHRPLSKFPENRYPDVLSAHDIPQDAYEQHGVESLSLSFEMKPMPSLSFTNSLTCCSAIKARPKSRKRKPAPMRYNQIVLHLRSWPAAQHRRRVRCSISRPKSIAFVTVGNSLLPRPGTIT